MRVIILFAVALMSLPFNSQALDCSDNALPDFLARISSAMKLKEFKKVTQSILIQVTACPSWGDAIQFTWNSELKLAYEDARLKSPSLRYDVIDLKIQAPFQETLNELKSYAADSRISINDRENAFTALGIDIVPPGDHMTDVWTFGRVWNPWAAQGWRIRVKGNAWTGVLSHPYGVQHFLETEKIFMLQIAKDEGIGVSILPEYRRATNQFEGFLVSYVASTDSDSNKVSVHGRLTHTGHGEGINYETEERISSRQMAMKSKFFEALAYNRIEAFDSTMFNVSDIRSLMAILSLSPDQQIVSRLFAMLLERSRDVSVAEIYKKSTPAHWEVMDIFLAAVLSRQPLLFKANFETLFSHPSVAFRKILAGRLSQIENLNTYDLAKLQRLAEKELDPSVVSVMNASITKALTRQSARRERSAPLTQILDCDILMNLN